MVNVLSRPFFSVLICNIIWLCECMVQMSRSKVLSTVYELSSDWDCVDFTLPPLYIGLLCGASVLFFVTLKICKLEPPCTPF